MEEHLAHLRLVLLRFMEEGLKLRLKKCFFGIHEMEYLGYNVSSGKLSVSTKKLEADLQTCQCLRRKRKFAVSSSFQLLRQIYSSFQRPYGSIDGLIKEVPTTESYADACLFESL
jgi:hypothetical protein